MTEEKYDLSPTGRQPEQKPVLAGWIPASELGIIRKEGNRLVEKQTRKP